MIGLLMCLGGGFMMGLSVGKWIAANRHPTLPTMADRLARQQMAEISRRRGQQQHDILVALRRGREWSARA